MKRWHPQPKPTRYEHRTTRVDDPPVLPEPTALGWAISIICWLVIGAWICLQLWG